MENNQRNSRKRLNSLILLVAFTAVMLIVSTYAWFSTQKNVTLSGIEGNVKVAEGLQISLDAKTWKNEINFSEFTKKYDEDDQYVGLESSTYLPTTGATLEDPDGDGTANNVVPTELLPVSTTGTETIDSGTTINMYRGLNEEGFKLTDINKVDEMSTTVKPGYYAIDLYLQNSSATDAADTLQLEENSLITIATDKASTGLQNTLRVALALTNTEVTVDGVNGQSQILTNAATKKIYDVAIWEPNADAHSVYVQNNQKLATAASTDETTGVTTYTWGDNIGATTQHFTYAVNASAAVDDTETADIKENTIDNVYYWAEGNTKLTQQKTLQTSATTAISTTALKSAKDGSTSVTMAANKYIKARLYIWLEGQDVDCINQASYGGKVVIDFGFSKPGTQNGGQG